VSVPHRKTPAHRRALTLSLALVLAGLVPVAARGAEDELSLSPQREEAPARSVRIGPIEGPDLSRRHALAGVLIRINGCEALDVYHGPDGPTEILLQWTQPADRVDWLQSRFDGYLARWGDDAWQAWLDLGGGLTQSTRGMALHVYPTGRTERCETLELPVFDVAAVAPWDVETGSPVSDAAIPRGAPFDPQSPAIAELLRSRSGRRELTIQVRGTTDPSLGWPPWMLIGVGGEAPRSEVDYGFIELRFAQPEVQPVGGENVAAVLAARGVAHFDELPDGQRQAARREAQTLVRRGPFAFTGYLTGQVERFRDTEALYLTPVFVVTGTVAAP
jgi:hypothetical protein